MNEKVRTALSPEVAALSQGSLNGVRNAQMLSALRDEYNGGPADWLLAKPVRNSVDDSSGGPPGVWDRLIVALGQPPGGGATTAPTDSRANRRALRSASSR